MIDGKNCHRMALLGEDGSGYELAKRLEVSGSWKSWLGDSHYMQLLPYLNSLCVWQDFMLVSEAKSKAQIHLQLRVRALLFDKASSSLYLRSPPVHASSLHPSCK